MLLVACGPRVQLPSEEFRAPTCESDGPVRLLPGRGSSSVLQLGDRLIVTSRSAVEAGIVDQIWSVGPCGEDPVLLREGEWSATVVGDLLLACGDDGQVLRLDPAGTQPPVELFGSASCRLERTDAGLLAHDPIAQAILLRPSPHEDDVDVSVIASEVVEPGGHATRPPYAFQTNGAAVFVLDRQSRLLQIGLQTRESTIVAEGVAEFALLPGGDRILIEDRDRPEDAPSELARVRLVDLASGDEQHLDAMSLGLMTIAWPIAVGIGATLSPTAFDLRTGERLAWPSMSGGSSGSTLDGPRFVLLADEDGEHVFYVWSEATRSFTERMRAPSCSHAQQHNGRLEVLLPSGCGHGGGELWLADFDGGEPVVVATDLSPDPGPWLTRTDRLVWTAIPSTDPQRELAPFDLVVTDLHDDHHWRLDQRASLLPRDRVPELGDDILYTVDDGERSGLWRSALP